MRKRLIVSILIFLFVLCGTAAPQVSCNPSTQSCYVCPQAALGGGAEMSLLAAYYYLLNFGSMGDLAVFLAVLGF